MPSSFRNSYAPGNKAKESQAVEIPAACSKHRKSNDDSNSLPVRAIFQKYHRLFLKKFLPNTAVAQPCSDPSREFHNDLGSVTVPDLQYIRRRILYEISQAAASRISSQKYYRTRKVIGHKKYTLAEMKAPPSAIATAARYNRSRQSVLYLSDSEQGAIGEVMPAQAPIKAFWVQEFQVENLDKVLDLTNWPGDSPLSYALSNYRIFDPASDSHSERESEYQISRFIAGCAISNGFQGIKYHSAKGLGTNLVIFNPEDLQENLKPVGQPRIVTI